MSVLFQCLIQTLNSFDPYVGWSIAELKKTYRLTITLLKLLKSEKQFSLFTDKKAIYIIYYFSFSDFVSDLFMPLICLSCLKFINNFFL